MSRQAVSIEGTYQPTPVDLWGHDYETVDLTRAAEKKVRELQDEAGDETDDDKAFEIIAKMLDLKLSPVAENGRAQKASTILKRKWKAGELSSRQLLRFIDNITLAEEADRPI